MTCVYVNPKTHEYWIIDYRIYDPDRDAKTKLHHLQEMLHNAYFVKNLPFRTVLVDSWYASMAVLKKIESLSKTYYAPLKRNRLVNDSDGIAPHKRIEDLTWTEAEVSQGKRVHIRKFPRGHQVKLFRIASGTGRTEYIVTNDLSQSDATATHQECRIRWKIEQLHRELKQTKVAFGSTEFIVLRSKTLNPYFVYLLAQIRDFRENAIKTMTGSTGRQRVVNECFDDYFFPNPSSDILGQFESIVAPMFRKVQNLSEKNTNLRQTRDILLPKLISGEIDISELDIDTVPRGIQL